MRYRDIKIGQRVLIEQSIGPSLECTVTAKDDPKMCYFDGSIEVYSPAHMNHLRRWPRELQEVRSDGR